MKKFLKAVRLDNSDAELYKQGGACDEDSGAKVWTQHCKLHQGNAMVDAGPVSHNGRPLQGMWLASVAAGARLPAAKSAQ